MSPTPAESPRGLSTYLKHTSWTQVFIIITALAFVRFIIRGIYRVYFHPLSKFPGPKWRAFTRIPNHFHTWNGTQDIAVREMHRKYGHVVRTMPDELSFTHPDSWKDIYGHGSKGTRGSPPEKDYAKYGTAPNKAYNLLQARDPDHGRMRKIFTPAFSDRALKQQEPLFVKYTDQLVSRLKEDVAADPEKKCDMVRMYNFTTFDVMGDLTFGEPLHMLDNAEYDPWVQLIFKSIKFASRLSIARNYPAIWGPFKAIVQGTANKKRAAHFEYAVTRVTKRLEKGRAADGVDLWDLVLSQKEGRGLDRGEMDANASLFMIAGTETTATLVSGLTYYLLKNPESLKKLVAEVRGAFPTTDAMTMEQLAALPYLAACIKEAFRLYPPVPLGLPRLTPPEGSTIVGEFVPPNTTLVIPQHAMYTHESNFKRPFEYIPERWLGDTRFESDARQAVQPFSVGSRDCVGKNMAYHEMRLLIAKVLYSFDLDLAPESDDWADQETYILWQKKPLMCKLKAVN